MRSSCWTLLAALVLFTSFNTHADAHKKIVGATEAVFIEQANQNFKGRVDTGAKTSSIHAENIQVAGSGNPRGKPISFYLVTSEGRSKRIETHVDSVVKVRTSEGAERRYVVALLMKWNGSQKTVLVTLNDRSKMKYRLLLGRNWLHGDFIVDVDKNTDD